MSSETEPVSSETEGLTVASRTSGSTLRWLAGSARGRVVGAGALAALATAVATTLRVLHNVPFDPLAVSASVLGAVEVTAAVAVALALAAVGFATDRPPVRIGCLFAGVFGALAAVVPAARVPAAVAVTAGGGAALATSLGAPESYRGVRRHGVAGGFLLAVALSLASTLGLASGGVRELGAVAYLAALAALTVRVRGDPLALVAGAAGFAAVVAASASSPYVAGSALLVGFAVVGAPHLLVAAAVGGAVAAAVAGLRRRSPALAIGAALLVVAGAPATPTAATAVVLGAGLATLDRDSLPGTDDAPEVAA